MKNWWRVFSLTLLCQARRGNERAVSIGFLLSFAALCVFGVGPQALARPEIGVGLLWIMLLLSLTLALPAFVEREEEQGALPQWQLLPLGWGAMLSARALAVFCTAMLPLLLLLPLLGAAFMLPLAQLPIIALLLLLGGWSYWLIAACASLLLLGSARALGLQLLVTLPLCVPILIFGCSASLREEVAMRNATMLLSSAALALTAIAPWLMGSLLRMHRNA